MNSFEYYYNSLKKWFPFVEWKVLPDNIILGDINFYHKYDDDSICWYNSNNKRLYTSYELKTFYETIIDILEILIQIYEQL